MKILLIRTFVWGLRFLYFFMKLRPTKNKIVYCSRQSDTPSHDLLAIGDWVNRVSPQTKQQFRTRYLRDEKGLSLSYLFHLLGDAFAMADAKVIVADTYSIPLSCLTHKKGVKRVQIWHALAAVKQFGLQAAGKAQGRDQRVAKALCMHQNYTHVIAPSLATGEFYQKAFGCSSQKISLASLPRVDEILKGDSRKEEFLAQNPEYRGKKLIVYLPTFREGDATFLNQMKTAFGRYEELGLIAAPHPISGLESTFTGDFSTYDFMKLADEIVTDYSACSVEGSLLKKPIRFYVPDYEEYKREQGLNVELKEWFPTQCFGDADGLAQAVANGEYPYETLARYADTFVENQGTNNAETLAKILCSLL